MIGDQIQFTEISCKSALHNLKSKMPFDWDLNVFRGCQHHCKYCFALYSHDYLDDAEYYKHIYIKTNIAEMLDKKLSSKRWQKQVINLGGVTDSYQPIEKKYALMPDVWRVLIKHKNPVVISTKSDLILRDFELIAELSNCTAVNIAATIITTDEMLKSKLEPNTASISQRFKMLKEFQKTKVSRGVHIMPLIPYITDSFSNLNSIFFMSKEIQIDYILTGLLNLRGKSRNVFLDFLQNEMPFYYQDIFNLFNNKDLKTSYLQSISLMLSDLYKYHDISDAFMAPLTKRMKELDKG